MFLEALGWLLLLLFIGVITPGPNNITCTVHSALHGPKSNIPLIGGMAIGFFIVQLVCGLTVHYFSNESQIADNLNIVGLLFLTILGLGVIALGWSDRVLQLPDTIPRLGPKTGVGMQFVNGKEWFMVFTVMSTVLQDFGGGVPGILLVTAFTIPGAVMAMFFWTYFGAKIQSKFEHKKFVRNSFTLLGLLLITTGFALSFKA